MAVYYLANLIKCGVVCGDQWNPVRPLFRFILEQRFAINLACFSDLRVNRVFVILAIQEVLFQEAHVDFLFLRLRAYATNT